MSIFNNQCVLLIALLASLIVSGCASVTGERDPRDPWESYNRTVYKFNDGADKAVLKPVATAYRFATPKFVRAGVTNFFSNIDDVTVFLNDMFQGKFRRAVAAGGRFIINTTFGLGGLIDVAGVAGEPKHYEDFGQTLGVWGMGPGPYFMLPLLGPSTVRDASGRLIDNLFFIPANYVRNQNITTGAFLLNSVNLRSNLLGTEKVLEEASVDRYSFLRDAYLQRRESVVYDGNPPKKKDQEFEDFDEPEKIPGSEKKN